MNQCDPERHGSFRSWIISVACPSVTSVLANLIVTGVVSIMLLGAHQIVTQGTTWSTSPPKTDGLRDFSIQLLLVLILLLSLTSVLQTAVAKFDSLLIRRELRRAVNDVDPHVSGPELMAQRLVLETWFREISAAAQALGYSIVLAIVGGLAVGAGVIVALATCLAVASKFVRVARQASIRLQEARRTAQVQKRRRRVSAGADDKSASSQDSHALVDALYERDVKALRLPIGLTFILSLVLLGTALSTAILTTSPANLLVVLLVILVWRQRMLDCVQSLGPLTWSWTQRESRIGVGGTESSD